MCCSWASKDLKDRGIFGNVPTPAPILTVSKQFKKIRSNIGVPNPTSSLKDAVATAHHKHVLIMKSWKTLGDLSWANRQEADVSQTWSKCKVTNFTWLASKNDSHIRSWHLYRVLKLRPIIHNNPSSHHQRTIIATSSIDCGDCVPLRSWGMQR